MRTETQSRTRTDEWLASLGPARRREMTRDLKDQAAELMEAGFDEEAEKLRQLAFKVAGWGKEAAGVADTGKDLQGHELVAWLLERDERDRAWLGRKLFVSQSHAYRMVEGERPITEQHARNLAKLWPEYRWQRFMTPAAVNPRRRAG